MRNWARASIRKIGISACLAIVISLAGGANLSRAASGNLIPSLDPKSYSANNMTAISYADPLYSKYREYDLALFNPPIEGDPANPGRILLQGCDEKNSVTCISSFSIQGPQTSNWVEGKFTTAPDEWQVAGDKYRLVAYRYDLAESFTCHLSGVTNPNCRADYNWLKLRIFAGSDKGDITNAFEGKMDSTFRVMIRVPKSKPLLASPWFWSRTWDTKIQISSDTESLSYVFQGKPVEVPQTLIGPAKNELFPSGYITGFLRSGGRLSPKSIGSKRLIEAKSGDFYAGSQANNVGALTDFSRSESLGLAKTWYNNQIWSFDSSAYTFFDNCTQNYRNSYAGLVSSNASIFSLRAPTFDQASGSLEFRIASTHFAQDGKTPNSGLYSVTIPIEVARCVWGSKFNSSQARISITSDDGSSQIALTSTRVNGENILFSATNLHFSSPTVRISFGTATKSLKCINSKKKETSPLPNGKCPSGYTPVKS